MNLKIQTADLSSQMQFCQQIQSKDILQIFTENIAAIDTEIEPFIKKAFKITNGQNVMSKLCELHQKCSFQQKIIIRKATTDELGSAFDWGKATIRLDLDPTSKQCVEKARYPLLARTTNGNIGVILYQPSVEEVLIHELGHCLHFFESGAAESENCGACIQLVGKERYKCVMQGVIKEYENLQIQCELELRKQLGLLTLDMQREALQKQISEHEAIISDWKQKAEEQYKLLQQHAEQIENSDTSNDGFYELAPNEQLAKILGCYEYSYLNEKLQDITELIKQRQGLIYKRNQLDDGIENLENETQYKSKLQSYINEQNAKSGIFLAVDLWNSGCYVEAINILPEELFHKEQNAINLIVQKQNFIIAKRGFCISDGMSFKQMLCIEPNRNFFKVTEQCSIEKIENFPTQQFTDVKEDYHCFRLGHLAGEDTIKQLVKLDLLEQQKFIQTTTILLENMGMSLKDLPVIDEKMLSWKCETVFKEAVCK